MEAQTLYDESSGKVLANLSGFDADFYAINQKEGCGYVDGKWDTRTHYILDGEVTERPASPVTRNNLTLLDVPEGSTLWINGESYAAEGEVELEFPLPGTYRLRVECFPFLDWTDEVVVP